MIPRSCRETIYSDAALRKRYVAWRRSMDEHFVDVQQCFCLLVDLAQVEDEIGVDTGGKLGDGFAGRLV